MPTRLLLVFLVVALATPAWAQMECRPGKRSWDVFRETGSVVPDRPASGSAGFSEIDRRLRDLLKCPGLGLVLTGYADDTEADPDALSLRRAQSVAATFTALGFAPDRFFAVGAGVHPDADSTSTRPGTNLRARRVDAEAVMLDDLPGWTPRAEHDPAPFKVAFEHGPGLWLDWDPRADSACPGDEALVLRGAFLGLRSLTTGCLSSARPAPTYTHHATAELTHYSREHPRAIVDAVDGVMGEGRQATSVGWLIGPTGSVLTDGRFCERYRVAHDAVLAALRQRMVDDGTEARAGVERAAVEILPFADAVESVGGVVGGVFVDCRPLPYDDWH